MIHNPCLSKNANERRLNVSRLREISSNMTGTNDASALLLMGLRKAKVQNHHYLQKKIEPKICEPIDFELKNSWFVHEHDSISAKQRVFWDRRISGLRLAYQGNCARFQNDSCWIQLRRWRVRQKTDLCCWRRSSESHWWLHWPYRTTSIKTNWPGYYHITDSCLSDSPILYSFYWCRWCRSGFS